MIIPEKLNLGDKIGIIAPARKISFEELKPSIEIFESWGLVVVLGKFLFEEDNQFSGSLKQRLIDLQNMINDDSISAIVCARGGYGTVQLIEKIDFSKLYNYHKWIIGYSDITVLHSHLNQLGLATLHATMPINFSKNTIQSLESLKYAIFGIESCIKIPPHELNRFGKVEAEIVGGNLSVLYSLLGSKSDIDTDGRILFLEDLDEYLYHVDRMLINIKRNGKFSNLKGMIIGTMCDMNDNNIPFGKTPQEIILEHIEEYDFPICFGFPSGHLNDNRSIKLGVNSLLEINENGVNLSQFL
tara:strand:- start:577 stop:1476 length:900 start_codon:yes stop_codon:yes gene_type:complete